MAEAFLSQIWYRVADLQPRLRGHVSVHRHRYRGRPWYVLHDHATGRVHRFTPAAYMLIGQMTGGRTVDEVWQHLAESQDEDAPGQDQVIQLLSQLHQNDLIQYRGAPDVADLLERYNKQSGQLLKQNLTNPMSFRIPLWDPNTFLARTLPYVRALTGWFGLGLWLVVVAAGLLTAGQNWDALTADITGRILSTSNLLISLVTYPLLKALHEMAHGYMTKVRGGDVHEMGIMFLVMFPVPYVDASAASAFRNKWHRAAVSGAGIAVETFVASLALLIWASAEPGITRALAYNLVLIGGLSTIVVNGNPLLKFDGYYVLSDLIEIPNFGTRANRYVGHIIQRHVFGAKQLKEQVATWGEKVWFLSYAPAAYVYRLIVMVGIALYVAQKFFVIGVLLAFWSVFNAVVKPIAKNLRHVVSAPALRKVRRRAMWLTFGSISVLACLVFLLPLPLRTDSVGVIWLPDEAHVRARTAGFLNELTVGEGQRVGESAVVARLSAPEVTARLAVLEGRVEESQRRLIVSEVVDRREAEIARIALAEAEAQLNRERERLARLTVYAQGEGVFQPVRPGGELEQIYLNEGDLIGYVLPPAASLVRAVISQDDIALVRERPGKIEIKVRSALDQRHSVTLARAVPSASDTLPSLALSINAGGPFATDPSDPEGLRVIEQIFVLDLSLPPTMEQAPFGARVLVRFDHGLEPAGAQIWRRVRQVFLRYFNA